MAKITVAPTGYPYSGPSLTQEQSDKQLAKMIRSLRDAVDAGVALTPAEAAWLSHIAGKEGRAGVIER